MKIDEAVRDINEFTKKRLEQLRQDLGIIAPSAAALSVSFDADVQIRTTPVEVAEIEPGIYQDIVETMHVEVIRVNSGMVEMEVLLDGHTHSTKRLEWMSSGLFPLMFKKAFIDPMA